MKIILTCLLALGAFSMQARCEGPPSYKDSEELLLAVNAGVQKLGCPAFSRDGLTVCIAEQLRLKGEPAGRGLCLLEDMVAKRAFRFPVGLVERNCDEVKLAGETIALPAYKVLEVRIFNVPWGSVDKEGKPLKVTWDAIPIATALAGE